jgi:two-component system, response regulator
MSEMSNRVILLVEDDPDDEDLALRAFQRGDVGNPVAVARDGVEALDYLYGTGTHACRDASVMPAVVLLDLKLPRMSGLDVLRHIRADARTQCLPVVILTSSHEDQDVMQCYRLGANSYVRKPVDFTQFVDAVRQMGRYWLLLNYAPQVCAPPGPAR